MKKMGYGGMGMTKMGMAKKGMTTKMMTGGMVNPNAAVKAATTTKNQVGGGNPKATAQTKAPAVPGKNKSAEVNPKRKKK